MTESDWLTSAGPLRMLEYVAPRISERKLRLYCVAMWRSSPLALDSLGWTEQDLRDLYCLAERHADGEVSNEELVRAKMSLRLEVTGGGLPYPTYARQAIRHILNVLTPAHRRAERRTQGAHLLRCIAGNPWRPPPSISEWITPTVHGIAQAIYDERRWAELPILADALEDAGCPATVECERCEVETVGQGGRAALSLAGVSVTIGSSKTQRIYLPDCRHCHGTGRIPHPLLAHLRDGGPHARGCHAIDCVLGKE